MCSGVDGKLSQEEILSDRFLFLEKAYRLGQKHFLSISEGGTKYETTEWCDQANAMCIANKSDSWLIGSIFWEGHDDAERIYRATDSQP